MPNDPYQIGEDNSGITLVLADRGVSVAAAHAASHVGAGADKIRDATTTLDGLMTAAHALKLSNIEENAQVTSAARIATALNGVTTATPEAGDQITFLDGTDSALKRVTLTNFFDFLDDSFVRITGTQSVTGTKTFTSVVLTTADINGGTINGAAITLSGASPNTFIGALPVANGGTGSTSAATGTGGVVLDSGPTITDASLVTPALGTPYSGLLTNCTGLPIANTTGTLAVAKGGTGVTTLTAGVVRADGTSAFTTGAVSLASEVSGVLPITNGGTGATTLAAGVVKSNGTALSTSAVGLASADVSGVLPIANGGTGFSTNPYGQLGGQTAAGAATYSTLFEKLVIDTSLSLAADFDQPENNRLRYTGTTTRRFLVFGSVDIEGALGAHYSIKIYRNGVEVLGTECRANAAGKTGSGTPIAKLVTNWIIELSQNQYVEVWVASTLGDSGTPQRMRLVATPV